jgi:ring-1,2-phenylacetyl-CoA epoxidase subunit PaaC
VVRLGDGSGEGRARMIAGLEWMWRFVDELFDAKDGAPSLRGEWDGRIARTLAEAKLELPKPRRGVLGGRTGHHSEHLGHLLSEMQFLPRAYPGAVW